MYWMSIKNGYRNICPIFLQTLKKINKTQKHEVDKCQAISKDHAQLRVGLGHQRKQDAGLFPSLPSRAPTKDRGQAAATCGPVCLLTCRLQARAAGMGMEWPC